MAIKEDDNPMTIKEDDDKRRRLNMRMIE